MAITTRLHRTGLVAAVVLLAFGAHVSSAATNHTVLFGDQVGFAYSPNSMSVNVGDTVTWVGDFAAHPLSAVSVPTDAAWFHVATGTSFSYVVLKAGTYNYQCDFHALDGMTGLFTAILTGATASDGSTTVPTVFSLDQNYPNPFNPTTTVSYGLPRKSFVSITLFNAIGQKVADVFRGEQAAGSHTAKIDASGLPSGVYLYQLRAGDLVLTRRAVLLR